MKIRKKEETRPSNSDHGKLSILEKKATGKEKKEKNWRRKIFGGEQQRRKRTTG